MNYPEAKKACEKIGASLIDVRNLELASWILVTLRYSISDFWADAVNDKFVKFLPRLVDQSLRIDEIQSLISIAGKRMAIERAIRNRVVNLENFC